MRVISSWAAAAAAGLSVGLAACGSTAARGAATLGEEAYAAVSALALQANGIRLAAPLEASTAAALLLHP